MSTMLNIDIDVREAKRKLERVGQALRPRAVLKLVGHRYLEWIDQNFRTAGAERPWKPLSPNTLANPRRGGAGAQPLRDTGRMAQSFTMRPLGEGVVWVGTRDRKAEWHHLGTSARTITTQPPGRPAREQTPTKSGRPARRLGALMFYLASVGGKPVFRRTVRHPGIPARPLLPSERLADRLAQETVDIYVREALRG